MSHLQYTTKSRKGKHLNYEERIKIEALSKIGMKSETIQNKLAAPEELFGESSLKEEQNC